MSKFIDAEKPLAEIARRKKQDVTFRERSILIDMENAIESLQKEQPALPGVETAGIPGKDFIPDEWVDACEKYGKWRIVKQEQPAEWSEEDENALKYLHELISFGYTENFFDAQTAADMREWVNTRLKSLRPHWKPSGEQIKMLESLPGLLRDFKLDTSAQMLEVLREQLKKL